MQAIRRSSATVFLAGSVLLVGCDSVIGIEDWTPRDTTGEGDSGSTACVVEPGYLSGKYLLAISVTISPREPVLILGDLATPALASGTALRFDAQALSAADRRTPLAGSLVMGPFEVESSGDFTADLPGLQLPAEANPVGGFDLIANAVFDGNLCGDESFFCGDVTGTALAPASLDLTGSTFTLTRIDDPTNLPERPAVDCEGTLADPLP